MNTPPESDANKAAKEFDVIKDLLLTPLKQDGGSELPDGRKWKSACSAPQAQTEAKLESESTKL